MEPPVALVLPWQTYFRAAGDEVWLNSRRRPTCLHRGDGVQRHWLPGDLAVPETVTGHLKKDHPGRLHFHYGDMGE